VDSDHDLLIRLSEQVRQLEEQEHTRSTREWFIVGGLMLALLNAAIDTFAPRTLEPVAAMVHTIVGIMGG
jgi:hypothetical protein